jgi:hypothetical protein
MVVTTGDNTVTMAITGRGHAAWRAGGLAALIAATGSLVLYVAARLAGTDFHVTPAGAARGMDVNAVFVLITIAVPILLGTLVLRALAGRARAWSVLAWTGLALGLVTTAIPLTASADTSARLTLAAMHVLTGAAWWYALRHDFHKPQRLS